MKRKLLSGIVWFAAFSIAYVGVRMISGSLFQQQRPPSQELVTAAAGEANKFLPTMVDRDTELMNVFGVGSTLIYNYRIVNFEADEIDKAEFQAVLELLKPDVVRQACTTPETREDLLDQGIEMRYVYHDQNREHLSEFTVTEEACR